MILIQKLPSGVGKPGSGFTVENRKMASTVCLSGVQTLCLTVARVLCHRRVARVLFLVVLSSGFPGEYPVQAESDSPMEFLRQHHFGHQNSKSPVVRKRGSVRKRIRKRADPQLRRQRAVGSPVSVDMPPRGRSLIPTAAREQFLSRILKPTQIPRVRAQVGKHEDANSILVVGSRNAEFLRTGLTEILRTDAKLRVLGYGSLSDSLSLRSMLKDINAEKLNEFRTRFVVYMVDARDFYPVFGRTAIEPISPIGLMAYRPHVQGTPVLPAVTPGDADQEARRLLRDAISRLQSLGGRAIVVGLPPLAQPQYNRLSQRLNALLVQMTEEAGVRYVGIWDILASGPRGFAFEGQGIDGKVRLLRTRDGVGFTLHGKRKIARRIQRYIETSLGLSRSIGESENSDFMHSSSVLPPFVRNQPVPITVRYVEPGSLLREADTQNERNVRAMKSAERYQAINIVDKVGRADNFFRE